MYEVNLRYFLFGVVIIMVIRLIDMLKMFNPKFEAPKSHQKVFYLFFGNIFILCAINGIIFSLKLFNILPIIFLLIGSGLFISDSLVKPSKNYLIAISFATIIGGLLIVPLFTFFQTLRLDYNIPYLSLIGIAITFFIALTIGICIYELLYYKYPNGLKELWDGTNVWQIFNNKTFVLILWILMIIETYLQLHDSTLISLFYQF